MSLRTKTSYHPHLLVAFYLGCLPSDWLQRIPRSTRHEWLHRDQTTLYGYDWSVEHQHLLDTLREVASSRQLLRINKALLRVIALKRFITSNHNRTKEKISSAGDVVLHTIHKITTVLSLQTALKYLQQPYS